LEALAAAGLVYACNCTRAQLEAHGEAGYPGRCREKQLPLDHAESCWRFRTDAANKIEVNTIDRGKVSATLPATMQDFVVRKKDGHAAYQLASLCDDIFFGADLIVRGADLWDSTLAQLSLANALGQESFQAATFYHHQLFYEEAGKLSKTTGAASVLFMRGRGATAAEVFERVAQMAGMHAKDWRELGDGELDKLVL
jgi:glutamyl-tRNA synthetase